MPIAMPAEDQRIFGTWTVFRVCRKELPIFASVFGSDCCVIAQLPHAFFAVSTHSPQNHGHGHTTGYPNTMHTDNTHPSLFVCSAAPFVTHHRIITIYYRFLWCAIRQEKGNAAQTDLLCCNGSAIWDTILPIWCASLRVCVRVINWKYKIAHRIAKQCRSR